MLDDLRRLGFRNLFFLQQTLILGSILLMTLSIIKLASMVPFKNNPHEVM